MRYLSVPLSCFKIFRMHCIARQREYINTNADGSIGETIMERLASGRPRLLSARFNGTLKAPMDVASCSASPRAPRLLSAHGYSFVLRACCHAHGYNFVLRAYCYVHGYNFVLRTYCRAHFASHAHKRSLRPRGPLSPAPPCRVCS